MSFEVYYAFADDPTGTESKDYQRGKILLKGTKYE